MVNFSNCKWGIFFLLFFLFFIFFNSSYLQEAATATPAPIINKNIKITSTISTILKAEPGETITIPLKVNNISTNAKELIEKIKLPEGWNLILKPTPFTLKAEETEIRLLTFLVSSYCLADDYTISYLLTDALDPTLAPTLDPTLAPAHSLTSTNTHNPNNPEIVLEKKFQIRILPTYKIEIISQNRESSSYVIAGEEYTAKFKIINQGNAPQEITLSAADSGKFPLSLEENKFYLDAGKSKIVTLTIKIPLDLINLQEDRISLTANLKNLKGEDIKFYHYSKIQLIPLTSGDADIYHRLPSTLSLKYKQGEDLYLKIKGQGILNDAGDTKINYSMHLNKFPLFDDSLQNNQDYSMRFSTISTDETNTKFNFYLGKADLRISPLLKNNIFYDGIGGSWENENFHIEAHYVNTGDKGEDGNEQKEKGYAISFGGEPFNNGWEISLNYLRSTLPETADISSIEIKKKGLFDNLFPLENNIFSNTNLELEYAQGNINQQNKSAFRSRITGKLQSVNFAFSEIYAEPGYPGGIEDINYQNVFFSKNFGERLSIGWNYQNQNKISIPETKKSAGIIFNYQQQNSRLFLLYQNSVEKEDFINKKNQDLYQLYFSHKEEKIHFKTHYKLKYVDDNQNNNIEENNRLYISAEYFPRTNQKYHLSYFSESDHFFSSYKKQELKFSAQYPLKPGDTIKAATSASQEENLATNLNLDLSYKHEFVNGLELELGQSYSLNTNKDLIGEEAKLSISPYIGVGCKHEFSNGGTLELKGLYSFSENTSKKGVNSAEISYHIPFGIPLGLKKDIGKIKGKIYMAEDQELSGIKGVLVRLNNFTTITDNQGNFLFQGLKAGEYYLQVDYSSLDENSITADKTPLKLKIEQGEEVETNIGICRKVIVKGEIIQYDFPPGKLTEKTNLIKKGGISNVYLELKNKNSGEIRRCMSDREGNFILADLRPGEWVFSITGINLPSFYYLANYPKELSLKAGEICKINIQVLPLRRKIKMIGNENNRTIPLSRGRFY